MASRSKKSSSIAPQDTTPSAASTPRDAAAAAAAANAAAAGGATSPSFTNTTRPNSPLGPTCHRRIVEKVELQNLNDRLACYIDRVRYLENENSRLSVEVQTSRDTVTRETTNIKQMYEHELADARKLLDETAREKAKLEIDTKRLIEENNNLKKSLDRKTRDLATAEQSAWVNKNRANDLSNKFDTACAERKQAVDAAKELERENEKLRAQVEQLRKHLEEETLARVHMENTVQSLREELSFKDQIHSQELTETRSRRQVEITEIDGRLCEQYEAKLKQSLQELREQYENQMRANREEIESLFDTKMKNYENANQRNANALASATTEELRLARMHIEGLSTKLGDFESTNTALQARVRELEQMLEADESELRRLRDEMSDQLQQYQDLLDIKVSLDLEIAAYDKLLRGEEQRLNITPSNSASASQMSQSFTRSSLGGGRTTPSSRRTPTRGGPGSGGLSSGIKRKRTLLEESEERNLSDFSVTSSAKGDIEIIEADSEGKYVKIHNKNNKEINVGGWQLVRTVGSNETAFRFHRSVKIDGNGMITVWSADTDATHEPPSNIVMKQQKWFIGDNMKTQLINPAGEEVAASERVKQQISSRASRHREAFGDSLDDLHYQQAARPASSVSSSVGRLFPFW